MKKLKILERRTSIILMYKGDKYEIVEFTNGYIYVSRWNYGVVWVEVTATKAGKKLIRWYKKNKLKILGNWRNYINNIRI